MPALRERLGDVPALAQVLVQKISQRLDRPVPTPEMLRPLIKLLSAYTWPGNIRELENVLERYLASFNGDVPPDSETLQMILPEHMEATRAFDAPSGLKGHQKAHDAALLSQAIAQCEGNYKAAAKLLGISYTTLWRKLKEHRE
jgi:propionate catabolism operon transcriptional regulator